MKKGKFLASILLIASMISLSSCANNKPYIGTNGNWWVNGEDLGVPATGPQGEKGDQGDTGPQGEPGQDGSSVTVVSVTKVSSEGNVDTYKIVFSDGTETTFTVTNGETITIVKIEKTSSSGLVDTYTITFSNGVTQTFTVTNGKDGANLTITSIEHVSSEGLIDTYVINYSDGSKFQFVVTNGADGLTPYIGENGNWWIGETDTGVLADWEKANNVPLTDLSTGLTYTTMTLGNKSGFVVTGWDEVLCCNFNDSKPQSKHLVIPNYVGSVPVIGIKEIYSGDYATKVTISSNTIYLWEGAFENNQALTEIDFNGSSIKEIPKNCFKGTDLKNLDNFPSSITKICDYAFSGTSINNFNFSVLKYIGAHAFDTYSSNYVYLPKTVEYVGSSAFASTRVYIEHETYPVTWASVITDGSELLGRVITNCVKNDDYIYTIEGENVTLYQYLKLENVNRIDVPTQIDGKDVIKIGYGFASTTPKALNYSSIESLSNINKEIHIPEGIIEIEHFALFNVGLMIFAPESLEKMSETILISVSESDDIADIKLNGESIWANSSYLALKSNDLPKITDIYSGFEDITKKEIEESKENRVGFGIDENMVSSDNNFYYINNGDDYSILSYKAYRYEKLTIPSTYNDKPINTILSKAICFDSLIKTIFISNGITKIRPFAITCLNVERLIIPESVNFINANGIYSAGSNIIIYVYANSKPVDWDSNWTNVASNVYWGMNGELLENNFFLYLKKNNQITLITYLGLSRNLYIPENIDGVPVTSIGTNFLNTSKAMNVYIPSSIVNVGDYAFKNTSTKTFNFYFEASSIGAGWSSYWYYNSYTGSTSYYRNVYLEQIDKFDYVFGDEYVYSISENIISLLSCCVDKANFVIPNIIDGKNVTLIKTGCFYLTKTQNIYLPQSISTIESQGIGIYRSSDYCHLYTDAPSRLAGWDSNYVYNHYYSSTSCIEYHYGFSL